MKRIVLLMLIVGITSLALSGCNSVSNTISSDGVTRVASQEEGLLQDISSDQAILSPPELLASIAKIWNDTIELENGEHYVCSAQIAGGDLSNYIVFDLTEKTVDLGMLMDIFMGDRKNQAKEVSDVSYEGQTYHMIPDSQSGRSIEELHYYVYGGFVDDLFDYQRETLLYDDRTQTITVDEQAEIVSDNDAINTAADILTRLGYAGMTILDGYNYQTEVTFYLLPQYTSLPVIADQSNAQMIRIKSTVSKIGLTELSGSGIFREIVNAQEVTKVMNMDGILSLAEAHLKSIAFSSLPPVSEVSLRHLYTYDELEGNISAKLVWYFEIPPVSVENELGTGTNNYSFAIDAVSGLIYGGF